MSEPFRTRRRIEWADTDAAGIAHFTAFLRWMEEAEHEFLRHAGLSVHTHDADGPLSWPRVSVKCDFVGAVHFEDVLDVDVRIERMGEKSITYGFTFSHDDRPVAEGQITAVCCRLRAGGQPQSVPIPAMVRARIGGPGD